MRKKPSAKDFFSRATWLPNKPGGKLVIEGVGYLPDEGEEVQFGMMIPGKNEETGNERLSILFAAIPVKEDKHPRRKYHFCTETFKGYIKRKYNKKTLELDIYFDLNERGDSIDSLKKEFQKEIEEGQEVPKTKTVVILGGG